MKRFFSKPTIIMAFLTSKGYTSGTLADRLNSYLKARGYDLKSHAEARRGAATASGKVATNIMQDNERAFWATANDL